MGNKDNRGIRRNFSNLLSWNLPEFTEETTKNLKHNGQ